MYKAIVSFFKMDTVTKQARYDICQGRCQPKGVLDHMKRSGGSVPKFSSEYCVRVPKVCILNKADKYPKFYF